MNLYYNYLKSVRVGPFKELLYWPDPIPLVVIVAYLLAETGDNFVQEDGSSKFILE
jgi:hypothetical protein